MLYIFPRLSAMLKHQNKKTKNKKQKTKKQKNKRSREIIIFTISQFNPFRFLPHPSSIRPQNVHSESE